MSTPLPKEIMDSPIWVSAAERRPEINARYYCRHIKDGYKAWLWKIEMTDNYEWFDEAAALHYSKLLEDAKDELSVMSEHQKILLNDKKELKAENERLKERINQHRDAWVKDTDKWNEREAKLESQIKGLVEGLEALVNVLIDDDLATFAVYGKEMQNARRLISSYNNQNTES